MPRGDALKKDNTASRGGLPKFIRTFNSKDVAGRKQEVLQRLENAAGRSDHVRLWGWSPKFITVAKSARELLQTASWRPLREEVMAKPASPTSLLVLV